MEENRIKEQVRLCYKALADKKATDITVIDISELSVVADYFIIASAENVRQTEALCDNVEEVLGRAGYQCRQIEGKASGNWFRISGTSSTLSPREKLNAITSVALRLIS